MSSGAGLKSDQAWLLLRQDSANLMRESSLFDSSLLAGDTITMPEDSFLMVHCPHGGAVGKADEIRDYADLLDQAENTLTNIYAKKTGLPREEITALLSAESWMAGPECVKKGFADKLAEPVKVAATANPEAFDLFAALPVSAKELIGKVESSAEAKQIAALLAVAEAANRPNIKIAPMKSIDHQAMQSIQRSRELIIQERTATSNHIRGLLLEFGLAIPKGLVYLRKHVPLILEDADISFNADLRSTGLSVRVRMAGLYCRGTAALCTGRVSRLHGLVVCLRRNPQA